ncbi:UDP-N-acetylmuramoyl-tripeptide--D-alanyl-D-alanine ligase [Ectobacillus ponti]|uniref:UDP-N-acetylmuramoyl-tripeptide--D-alanyl-D-alanine ligase n=1 Tax=Ectobacillus ponti TaxID=2961894 RepID=A0AA41XD54_9BACI|nr:UDP-N-acetylmuramoyl-tripeptide--D-alanyl-D-alanine ligase [Ectobacillus ponti]MCP8971255.1 UDP-N-acetylmuramoyl-tripeptide--D-alanyl-D-alanine ligase [Ectobacillus ponti]
MIRRTLQQVQSMVSGSALPASAYDTYIEGVSIDTRSIGPGMLYVPIRGERFDGHSFAGAAVENGAAAMLWQKDAPQPPAGIPVILVDDTLQALQQLAKAYLQELSVKVIGVTGSNGKTTVKDMVTSLLATTYKVQKTEGNFNNHIGLPLTILRLEEDTEVAVLEMGMSAFGEIEFLTKLAQPHAAIITNIGESHMQDLGSRAGIARAKLEIVLGLQENGLFVYSGDEPLLAERVKDLELPGPVITFGEGETNDFYPSQVQFRADGMAFCIPQEPELEFFVPVLGKHNVYNALACMAVARHFGVTWENIQLGLSQLEMTKMRLEIIKLPDGLTIINDAYNASPTSMKAAIALLGELNGYARKIAVLGDMLELGDYEEQFHYEVGASIPEAVDYVYTYGNLARQIADGAAQRLTGSRVKTYMDKEELARDLKELVQPDDVVLVKASRGMRLEDVIQNLQRF